MMTEASVRAGFYSGSFDPPTHGHIDIIIRALRLFPRLVIGVGTHHGKAPLFSPSERAEMLRESLAAEAAACAEIVTFDGLVVEAARQHGASAIVRGIRDAADLAYEMQMAGMNGTMAPDITTIFLPALPRHAHIAATFVRQIAGMGGDVSPFVPHAVAARLAAKFPPR